VFLTKLSTKYLSTNYLGQYSTLPKDQVNNVFTVWPSRYSLLDTKQPATSSTNRSRI